jgi:hypothetical protein
MSDAELLLLVESRKKSGVVAALMNMFIPGLGYLYCGRWLLALIVFMVVVPLTIITIGLAWVIFVLPLFIDGFLCAGRYNRKLIERILEERATSRGGGFADSLSQQAAGNAAIASSRGFADS